MSIVFDQKKSKASGILFYLALIALILFPLSALGTKFGLYSFKVGFPILSGSVLISFLVLLTVLFMRLFKRKSAQSSRILVAAFMALIPVITTGIIMLGARDAPMIHDVSTNLTVPPQFVAAVALRGSDSNPLQHNPKVAEQQSQAFPDIISLYSDLSPEQAFRKATEVLQAMGLEVHYRDEDLGVIEAVATTFWFGFKDDMIVRIKVDQSGSKIDLRSVSRVGEGDLGANAKRIRTFREQFNQ